MRVGDRCQGPARAGPATGRIIGNVEYKNKTKQNYLAEPNITLMFDDLQHFLGNFEFV